MSRPGGGIVSDDRRKTVFHGRVIEVAVEQAALPDGRVAELEIVHHPGGAAVVALEQDGRVCLLRQYRHAAGGWIWELPAGRLEPEEAPRRTAARELLEEAGMHAARWESLGRMLSSPGVCTEVIHLFLARELARGETAHETHELIEIHWLPLADALAMAARGEISDAKTVAGLFRAHVLIEKRSPA
jgi:ADP-ribose pyrophosphatase